jgi:cytochrome c oxidase subunit II
MNFWLAQASTSAPESDYLMLALVLASIAILILVFGLMFIYAFKYRATNPIDRGQIMKKTWRLEITWTIATMAVFFGLFVWGADLFVRLFRPPAGALQIYIVGKQWMWKIEHEGGQREINSLHVPIGRKIQLVLTSEDVIHDFAVPAFRIRHDVLPGRYETLWFEATMPGTYHLFCNQLCGTGHSQMVGEVVVMSEADYENWLAENGAAGTLAEQGKILFMRNGCSGCHGGNGAGGSQSESTVPAPPLAGLYGSPVTLVDDQVVIADDGYIHDCILTPEKRRVASYPPVMPSFSGILSEDDVLKLVAYIKSLAPEKQL